MAENTAALAPVELLNDSPAKDKLLFDFEIYTDTLASMIASRQNATPFVISINGPWASGKTTLLKAIKTRLDGEILNDIKRYRRCKTVCFQAWKYQREDMLLPAIVEAIFKAMASDGFFTLAKAKIDHLAERINKSRVFASICRLTSGVDISEFFSDLPEKEKLFFFDTFHKFFNDLIWTFLNWRFKHAGQEKPDDKKCALVILIDDLDRCPPRCIAKILEIINFFPDGCGLVFLLAGASETIARALVETRGYSDQDAPRFMEKSIQAVFSLPQINPEELVDLLIKKKTEAEALKAYLPELMPVLNHNPRSLKRFMTQTYLMNGLLQRANIQIQMDTVVFWRVMELTCPAFVDDVKKRPDNFFAFRELIMLLQDKLSETPMSQLNDDQLEQEKVAQSLRPYIRDRFLTDLVTRLRITPEIFSRFIAVSNLVTR